MRSLCFVLSASNKARSTKYKEQNQLLTTDDGLLTSVMKSMTGFGRGAASGEGFTVGVEIKTVNNRYLDIHLRAPQELNAIEMDIRKRVKARLSRGRVDLNISFDRTGSEATYEINKSVVSAYVDALREIQRQFNLGGDIDVTSIAACRARCLLRATS